MARPKAPTTLRLLHGESRPSRINRDEPVPAAVSAPVPSWFDERHALVWSRVCADLEAMHLLAGADRDTLAVFVRAVVRHEDAAREVMAMGVLVDGREGARVRNPATIIEAQSGEMVRRLAREFGLTPSARAGRSTPGSGGGAGALAADRILS